MNLIESKIDYWLERASSSIIQDGLNWYKSANEWATNISREYDIDQKKVIGILSALSVQKEWNHNKKLLVEFLECKSCGHLGRQLKISNIILNGCSNDDYIMSALSGRKTSSFFHNICYPDVSYKLTIDFRMWKFFKDDSWNHITPKRYDLMERVFKDKSYNLDISLPQLQAILWLTTKTYGRSNN